MIKITAYFILTFHLYVKRPKRDMTTTHCFPKRKKQVNNDDVNASTFS